MRCTAVLRHKAPTWCGLQHSQRPGLPAGRPLPAPGPGGSWACGTCWPGPAARLGRSEQCRWAAAGPTPSCQSSALALPLPCPCLAAGKQGQSAALQQALKLCQPVAPLPSAAAIPCASATQPLPRCSLQRAETSRAGPGARHCQALLQWQPEWDDSMAQARTFGPQSRVFLCGLLADHQRRPPGPAALLGPDWLSCPMRLRPPECQWLLRLVQCRLQAWWPELQAP